jgi:hypothetical protein
MIAVSENTAVPSLSPIHLPEAQHAWVERCRASIFEKDPLLCADDILDLALTLWDRPSCQVMEPEFAATLLFAGRLSRLN